MIQMAFKPKLGNSIGSTLAEQARNNSTALQNTPKEKKETPTFTDPANAKERIRIIFDDSSSMSSEKIKDARDGCIEFLRNCKVNETAVAVHVMNSSLQDKLIDLKGLTTNLPALSILIQKIEAVGGTPLYETLKSAQSTTPKATRYIVFSDGSPNTTDKKEEVIQIAKENETPVDTVLIAHSNCEVGDAAYDLFKELADRTGGYFLVFDRNKVDFKSAFKYLAPNLRVKLSDGKVRLTLEAGELK